MSRLLNTVYSVCRIEDKGCFSVCSTFESLSRIIGSGNNAAALIRSLFFQTSPFSTRPCVWYKMNTSRKLQSTSKIILMRLLILSGSLIRSVARFSSFLASLISNKVRRKHPEARVLSHFCLGSDYVSCLSCGERQVGADGSGDL